MAGLNRDQLRTFSKRTLQIESELERRGQVYESAAARMKANDRASLATRRAKDRLLTPALLHDAWTEEARTVGLESPAQIESLVVARHPVLAQLPTEDAFAALVDPETGLCAKDPRFGDAHVYEHVCAISQGRWEVAEVRRLAEAFLDSAHVVRLAPGASAWRHGREWSTVEHRALEDHVLGRLDQLARRPDVGVEPEFVRASLEREPFLGHDQAEAVRALCAPGPALRALISPAGHGKTTAVHAAAAAQLATRRQVLGLATTNKAVEGLRDVGLEAMTIARLRGQLRDGLAPGVVLVVDEVSQVSTRDAAVILDAVAVTPAAGVWFLGDPRQTGPVAAGGIAAELARMGTQGLIPAPELTENRRQLDESDRAALAKLRDGNAPQSQAIRTEAGWEHESDDPVATRDAMADAMVADIEVHGPDAVVAHAVSHVDCEDLADRIRARLTVAGRLGETGIAGPGWGVGQRSYVAGDRVLLHSQLHASGTRLHNGSVGTVEAVEAEGLHVRFNKTSVVVPASFVAGHRADGTPRLSHAWARTIEGAQGGTWDVVHLLGTGSLDALSGYVGQSRSRQPTHTWNTRAVPALDHGGVLADDRDGAQLVLAALGREPDVTFAAADDAWPVHRRLVGERAEHEAVLARCPVDRSRERQGLVDALHHQKHRLAEAERELQAAQEALRALGPLRRVRSSGRVAHARAEDRLADARVLDRRRRELAKADEHLASHTAHQGDRKAFLAREGWRSERIRAIGDELAHHWAPVVLAAVRADDPLAFGIDRLRAARTTYGADLDRLLRSLPPDRMDAVERARREAVSASAGLAKAWVERAEVTAVAEQARERHWGRRDREAVERAEGRVWDAERAMSGAVEREREARRLAKTETEAQRAREQALRDNRGAMTELEGAVADIDGALDHTRPDRVLAMLRAEESPKYLTDVLGAVPETVAGQQAWCGLAWEIESYRDAHPTASHEESDRGVQAALGRCPDWYADSLAWIYLAGRVADGPDIVATAERTPADDQAIDLGDHGCWAARLDRAENLLEAEMATTVEPPGLGIDL